tara:strand:- start:2433 stop:2708 length:276 start_codon:yes stop_codon:yes gene_type:complete
MSKNDIEHNFSLATEWVLKNKMPATNEEKLLCYGYYKQATEGDNTSDKPWAIQLEKSAKWEAWTANKGMDSNEAKKKYISKIIELRNKYSL